MSEYGRGTYAHMLAVAKKKPRLQQIIDNIDNYTVEELKVFPNQPRWIREHLVAHKEEREKRKEGYLTPEAIAALMIRASKPCE